MAEEARSTGPSLWGRTVDYLIGRNTLIGIASLMLLVLSGYATWHGMRDFIIGVSTSPTSAGQELPGGFAISNDALVIGMVVALTFLMWLALRETFGARRRLLERFVTLCLYLFLVLWSVGFGYGFWWSLIAGQEATRTGLAGLQEDARDSAAAIAARLEAVRIQLDSVVSWSDSQMTRESTSGGSCGTPSGAGRGPLFGARQSVRDSVASLRDNITKSWITPVRADLDALRVSTTGLEGGTVEERQRRFDAAASDIRGRARNIAARSNELGRSTATEMRALATTLSVQPGERGFSCYDPTLAQRLRQAATQAEEPAVLRLRDAAFNEGPAGVANAIKNLWTHVGDYLSSLARFVASGGKTTGDATAGGVPITGRDLIALLATIGIDLGLFALTVVNPPREPPVWRPSGTAIRQIGTALRAATVRVDDARVEWLLRHFIHHNGASYLIIPNLRSCSAEEPEASMALAANQFAGVLADLGLVRSPTRRELRKLRKEKTYDIGERHSDSDSDSDSDTAPNQGLFGKAERALEIAHWSERARKDPEIYRLVDPEGLSPLLLVLSEIKTPNSELAAQLLSVPPIKPSPSPAPPPSQRQDA